MEKAKRVAMDYPFWRQSCCLVCPLRQEELEVLKSWSGHRVACLPAGSGVEAAVTLSYMESQSF